MELAQTALAFRAVANRNSETPRPFCHPERRRPKSREPESLLRWDSSNAHAQRFGIFRLAPRSLRTTERAASDVKFGRLGFRWRLNARRSGDFRRVAWLASQQH